MPLAIQRMTSLLRSSIRRLCHAITNLLLEHSVARRLTFRLSKIFPVHEPLTVPLLRLMMATNDVRLMQKLMMLVGDRIEKAEDFEGVVLNGELLHLDRMFFGHLYEAGVAFRAIDGTHPQLANAAVV